MPSHKGSLHDAAREGNRELLIELLNGGSEPNTFDELAYTPLHYAAQREDIEMMQLLLAAGADVNAHDEPNVGNTPLRHVAQSCSLLVAKFLVDAGADPTIQGWMQLTALHKASSRKRGDGPAVYALLREAARRRRPR